MVATKVIAGLVSSVLLCIGVPSWAQTSGSAAQQYILDIPQLPVIDALKEFTAQTGLQVSFWPDAKTDLAMLIGPLRGRFTAEAALTRMLAASGLAFQRTNQRSLVVMAPSMFRGRRNGVTPSDEDQDKHAEGRPNLRPQNHPPAPHSVASGKPGSVSDDGANDADDFDEVIVTGSGMERSGEGPAPVQVFTRQTIEELGAVSIPDVLQYMPQQPFNYAEHYYSGAQYSQMRGIGVDTTLILINGRRVVPTPNSLALNAFDLKTIPLAVVERIEVLSDSASAIYGADAMGVVVNVVLKKNIPQPVIDVEYGAAQGGGDLRRGAASAGYSSDRFRSSLILDLYERDFLFGAERDRWSNQDFTRYGGTDYRSPAGMPGNVSSLSGGNLPGLSSPFAMVPHGSTGIGLAPEDFVATAGLRNTTSTFGALSIVPDVRQRSVALFSEFDVAADLTAFAEVLYASRETTFQDVPYSMQGALVPATNPFNPFRQPVLVDFQLTGAKPRHFEHYLKVARGAGGLRGRLGATWQWEIAAVASTETDDAISPNRVSVAQATAALAAIDPSRALNPFVDGPVGSPELLASLIEPSVDHHLSRGRLLSAFMQGELFELPAGAMRAVIGGEWRDEAIIHEDVLLPVDDDRDVKAAFAEFSVPLIRRMPNARGDVLSMMLAARLDDYSDFGSTVNPQLGLMWRPTRDLLLRGSYGTSFRPPSLFELRSPQTAVADVPLPDPARNNAISNVTFVVGGNPDLRPIEANAMTAGFVLTPSAVPDLRLLANYWKIDTEERVTVLHFSTLLANEDMFSGRIVREARTPQDLAAGMPGRLVQLDMSRLNFGRLTTSGIDIEVNYEIGTAWGQFTQRLSATWVNEFTAVDLPAASAVNRVGIASLFGSIPRWRVVGTFGWKRGGVGLTTTLDWLPTYMDADTAGVTGRKLSERTLVDMQASFAMDELLGPSSPWHDLSLRVGVKNVFDQMPPFADIGLIAGFDLSQGSLEGRFGYIKLSKAF